MMKHIYLFILVLCISTISLSSEAISASDIYSNWAAVGNPRNGGTGTWTVSGNYIIAPDSGARISDFVMGDGIFSGSFYTTGSDDDLIGFIFGYQNMDNHYRFGWDAYDNNGGLADTGGSNGMRVIKEVSGTNYFLASNSTRWQRNVHYNFSVARTGSTFNVKIIRQSDSATILNYTGTDSQFAIGNVGIYTASQSPVYFYNIDVTVPEPSSLLMVFGILCAFFLYRK